MVQFRIHKSRPMVVTSHEFSPHLTSYLVNISFNNIPPSTHVFIALYQSSTLKTKANI